MELGWTSNLQSLPVTGVSRCKYSWASVCGLHSLSCVTCYPTRHTFRCVHPRLS